MSMSSKRVELKFNFENEEAARYFLEWLSEMGEQEYWEWMRSRELECDGDITVLQYNYDFDKYKVNTLIGRLDDTT